MDGGADGSSSKQTRCFSVESGCGRNEGMPQWVTLVLGSRQGMPPRRSMFSYTRARTSQ